jgi:methylenetetrahydrofolate reductase (NADPH)
MHLTCAGTRREDIHAIATEAWSSGVRHLVALRGDPPKNPVHAPVPAGETYAYASDLVTALRAVAPFEISVAAYPECHPQALSPEADLDNLKRKADAGAHRILTQFFFDNDDFLRFRDRAVRAGIHLPMAAGMLPVYNFAQASRFAGMCGARIPDRIASLLAPLDDAPWQPQVAGHLLISQCEDLAREGVHLFHFYTLNRAPLVAAACHSLGLRLPGPEAPASKAPLQETVQPQKAFS